MLGACACKNYREQPIYERQQEAGTRADQQPRSEFTEAGSGFIDNCGKENIVYNVPYTDNKGYKSLEAETYFYNIGDKNILILVDIKALRNVVGNVGNSFPCADVAAVTG